MPIRIGISFAVVLLFSQIMCSASKAYEIPEDIMSINDTIFLTKDTAFHIKRLYLGPNAKIITNGYDLRIVAKVIFLRKPSTDTDEQRIVSFTDVSIIAGENGRDAGDIYIIADLLSGGHLTISNHGQDGATGVKGKKGEDGKDGRRGNGRRWKDARGCVGRAPENGGPGRQGGQGGRGGNGGNGGTVLFLLKGGERKLQVSSVEGGGPGLGGEGGDGGDGGDGGGSTRGRNGCDGYGRGRDGSDGLKGLVGGDGSKGENGGVFNLSGNEIAISELDPNVLRLDRSWSVFRFECANISLYGKYWFDESRAQRDLESHKTAIKGMPRCEIAGIKINERSQEFNNLISRVDE